MRTVDGVPDGTSFSSESFGSTAEVLRAGAALVDCPGSPAAAGHAWSCAWLAVLGRDGPA
jgi:hypothetical protein